MVEQVSAISTRIIASASAPSVPGHRGEVNRHLAASGAPRVDHHEARRGALAARSARNAGSRPPIAAPDDDQPGIDDGLRSMPTEPPMLAFQPAAPVEEQMVRSSSEAPRRWKKRRSMPDDCTSPMVPA